MNGFISVHRTIRKGVVSMNDILILNNIMAMDLFKKGFELVNFRPDSKNLIATVFYFKRTQELEDYLWSKYELNL